MIASVEGVVAAHTADGVVVRVGGIGVAVHTTAPTRARLRVGESVVLTNGWGTAVTGAAVPVLLSRTTRWG